MECLRLPAAMNASLSWEEECGYRPEDQDRDRDGQLNNNKIIIIMGDRFVKWILLYGPK